MTTKYDVDYFINKFENIHEDKWCTNTLQDAEGRRCAIGHCIEKPYRSTDESNALAELVVLYTGVAVSLVNDGFISTFKQPKPKDRILALLNYIKSLQYRPQTKINI